MSGAGIQYISVFITAACFSYHHQKNIFENACSSFILIHVLKQMQQDYMLHFPKCEEELEIENVKKKKK
ncbi:hypothetical protein SLEP1_g25932 [Rubroshorea leprosula]|uniref:Uncharacterized protein n=1 Tax=Rubroshorea leprosula TaxID=152421 RepID=A0AAV5JXY5_9ROSI|nr:hypothetical protein SLEP1_g25932 [Rubroshorea leprosula]